MMTITWNPGVTLDHLERYGIEQAMKHYRGVKTTAANALGITAKTLDAKLERYRKQDEEEKALEELRKDQRDDFLKRSRGIVQSNIVPNHLVDQKVANGSENG